MSGLGCPVYYVTAQIDGAVDDPANLIALPPPCPEDINGDAVVNVLDLIDMLLCFGLPAVPGCEAEDIDGNGSA